METTTQCESCGLTLDDGVVCSNCDLADQFEPSVTDELALDDVKVDDFSFTSSTDDDALETELTNESEATGVEANSDDELNDPSDESDMNPEHHVEQNIDDSTVSVGGHLSMIGMFKQHIDKQDHLEVGSAGIVAGNLSIFGAGASRDAQRAEERTLFELTTIRPRSPISLASSLTALLPNYVTSFKKSELLVIDCAYKKSTLDAAYSVSSGLGIAEGKRDRVLLYSDQRLKDIEYSLEKLCSSWPVELKDGVIVVDGFGTSAESFADSILKDTSFVDFAKQELATKELRLIVVVSSEYSQRRMARARVESNVLHWSIPFIPTFLEQNYKDTHDELLRLLTQQRALGIWEADEPPFCEQILRYHSLGELEKIIRQGGPSNPGKKAAEMLEGSNEVEKAVLYAVSHFQQITPLEFRRVVEKLLTTSNPDNNGAGDQSLNAFWERHKDKIYSKWLQESSPEGELIRVVGLQDLDLREPLRRLFEQQHRFYSIDLFRSLVSQGIFFDPSLRLAENTTRLAVQMAKLHADEFNDTWLFGLIERTIDCFTESEKDAPPDPMFQFISDSPRPIYLVLSRIADALRGMFESPKLQPIAHNALEQLIKRNHHEEVLWLVKRLQFCPDFDQLHWLRQLLHRGNAKMRYQAFYHLYSHLKRMGMDVFDGLKKIEPWLPAADRPIDSYTPFECFALRFLVQYASESIQAFDSTQYGAWPSKYPLFAIDNLIAARERISLLANWLLHPGVEANLRNFRMSGTHMSLVAALLAEWSFILCGKDLSDSAPSLDLKNHGPETTTDDVSPPYLTASFLFDLLFEEFASRTNLNQQLELLKYWNRIDFDLLRVLGGLRPDSPLRTQLTWKLEKVGELMERIRERSWSQIEKQDQTYVS